MNYDFEEDPQIELKGYRAVEVRNRGTLPTHSVVTKYNAVILCDEGECEAEVNMTRLHLVKGSRVLLSHVMVERVIKMSPDFHAWILVVSDSFSLNVAMGIPTEMLAGIFRNPVKQVTDPAEWEMLNNFMRNIMLYDKLSSSRHSVEMAGAILRCILLMEAEIESQESSVHERARFTMADTYFRNFISLIEQHVKQEHEVTFYAEQLNITPKYLSEISKQKSGYKAKEIISSILVTQIKRDILISGKSMKTMAFDYGFADQSSLGKFFRKLTGQSPSAFKRANGGGNLMEE